MNEFNQISLYQIIIYSHMADSMRTKMSIQLKQLRKNMKHMYAQY